MPVVSLAASVAGLTLVLLGAVPTAMTDLCASVRQAIAAAPDGFASLRGRRDPYDDHSYLTSWRIPGATEDDCRVTYFEDLGYDIGCIVDANSYDAAKRTAQDWSATIEACLQANGPVVAEQWKERSRTRRDGGTSMSYGRDLTVPTSLPSNDAMVHISANHDRGRRGDRYTVQLTIELTNDER